MSNPPDFKSVPGMSKETREELAAIFNALSTWRDEIETANERCLGKVLDRTSAVARTMGWPDQAIALNTGVLGRRLKGADAND